ncbi:MAG: hypothetical protein ACOC8P_02865, partial [Dichotomicrobium sp.]
MDTTVSISANVRKLSESEDRWPSWRCLLDDHRDAAMYCDPSVVGAIAAGLRQDAYVIEAARGSEVVGLLPVIFMR